MTGAGWERVALVLLGVLLGALLTIALSPAIPRCPADAVLVGRGTFVDGEWSAYSCGPSLRRSGQ